MVFVAALTICLLGSVSAIRMLPILVLVAIPLHAQELSRPAVLDFIRRRRAVLLGGLAVVVVMAGVGATHLGRPTPSQYPGARVLDAIPAGAPVYNSYQPGWLRRAPASRRQGLARLAQRPVRRAVPRAGSSAPCRARATSRPSWPGPTPS